MENDRSILSTTMYVRMYVFIMIAPRIYLTERRYDRAFPSAYFAHFRDVLVFWSSSHVAPLPCLCPVTSIAVGKQRR